jgi:UDP-2-acetamido-3-amino-2,3-dideoxy-glucuronate N-acetyltransferase
MSLTASPRGAGLMLGEDVKIGKDVSFGAYVVVHDHVRIGHACTLEDHVVLGKRPRLASNSAARGAVGPLELGERVTVCAGAVALSGASVGEGVILGDQSFIRERSSIGAHSVVGRGSVIDNDVELGARVRVQSGVYLAAFTVVGDDAFIGPGVTTTNDDTMARHASEAPLRGAILGRACRVGAGAVLTPGVQVGEEAFVAAGAVVTGDVPARAVVMGAPARAVREVPEEDLLERWRR